MGEWSPSVAVVLADEVVRDYMLNYARSLIYTTSLSYANIVAIDCSFDMLENGTAKKVCDCYVPAVNCLGILMICRWQPIC